MIQLIKLAAEMLAVAFAVRALVIEYSGTRIPTSLRNLVNVALLLMVLIDVVTAVHAVQHPGEWDFLCFWLYGHAAIAHTGLYGPQALSSLPLPRAIGSEFTREVLAVGLPYPPPSILLFVPLGLTSQLIVASALWTTGLLVILGFAIVAVGRATKTTFLPAVATIVLALPATNVTINAQQVHAVALLGLAGAFALRGRFVGGIPAALAVMAKPYLALIVLWFALRRRWSAAAAAVTTLALATFAAIPFLGPAGPFAYVTVNPISLEPDYLYLESDSLYALLLKALHRSGNLAAIGHDPAYVIAAAILVLATAALTLAAPARDEDLSLGLFVAAGLLLYPAATPPYTMELALVMVALAKRFPFSRIVVAQGAAALFVAGTGLGLVSTFCVTSLLWATLASMLLVRRRSSSAEVFEAAPVASA